jgi:hypothetical protein
MVATQASLPFIGSNGIGSVGKSDRVMLEARGIGLWRIQVHGLLLSFDPCNLMLP